MYKYNPTKVTMQDGEAHRAGLVEGYNDALGRNPEVAADYDRRIKEFDANGGVAGWVASINAEVPVTVWE